MVRSVKVSVPTRFLLRSTTCSLIDKTTQYFVAGVEKGDSEEVTLDGMWFGCSNVSTPGGLCEVRFPLQSDKFGAY
jgi:hypothetical protein